MIACPVVASLAPTTAASATLGCDDQRRLDLRRRDPVPGHVHHVVDPAEQPQVAVVVELGAVTGEVPTGEAAPVGLDVALRITPDAAQHPRPGTGEGEIAPAPPDVLTGVVDQLGRHAGQRERGRTGLGGRRTGQRADHDPARLGLPPRVDDRAASAPDVLLVPHPRLGVDRLADRPEEPQRRQVVTFAARPPPIS